MLNLPFLLCFLKHSCKIHAQLHAVRGFCFSLFFFIYFAFKLIKNVNCRSSQMQLYAILKCQNVIFFGIFRIATIKEQKILDKISVDSYKWRKYMRFRSRNECIKMYLHLFFIVRFINIYRSFVKTSRIIMCIYRMQTEHKINCALCGHRRSII